MHIIVMPRFRIVTPEGLSIDTTSNRLLEVLAQNSHDRFL